MCAYTLPKIFRPVTLNTLIFYLAVEEQDPTAWSLSRVD